MRKPNLLHYLSEGGGIVPSPTPPWDNGPVSPLVQTCFGNDTVVLGADTTYLKQNTAPTSPAVAYVLVLPNGTYQRQYHTIIVPASFQSTTAAWKVTGTFNGFVTLKFSSTAVAAVLTWDGDAWVLIGGNVETSGDA